MAEIDDRIGDPLTAEQLAVGNDLDWDHSVYQGLETGTCRVCGFLTHCPDGAWKHAPAAGEMFRARTFLAIRAPT
jgi:hypothetical protein